MASIRARVGFASCTAATKLIVLHFFFRHSAAEVCFLLRVVVYIRDIRVGNVYLDEYYGELTRAAADGIVHPSLRQHWRRRRWGRRLRPAQGSLERGLGYVVMHRRWENTTLDDSLDGAKPAQHHKCLGRLRVGSIIRVLGGTDADAGGW